MLLDFLLHPLLIALLLGGGFVTGHVFHVDIQQPQMLAAAGIALVFSELAMVPLLLTRGATQATVSQAALGATVVHMLGCAAVATLVSFKLLPGQSFLFWMCGFYWMTLIGVAAVAVRALRRARNRR